MTKFNLTRCYNMYNLIDSLPYLVIGLIKNMQ